MTGLYQLLPLTATLWIPLPHPPTSTAWSNARPGLWLPKRFQVCCSVSSLPTWLLPSPGHRRRAPSRRAGSETSGHLGNTPCSLVLLLNHSVYTRLYISLWRVSFSSGISSVSRQLGFHQTLLPFWITEHRLGRVFKLLPTLVTEEAPYPPCETFTLPRLLLAGVFESQPHKRWWRNNKLFTEVQSEQQTTVKDYCSQCPWGWMRFICCLH